MEPAEDLISNATHFNLPETSPATTSSADSSHQTRRRICPYGCDRPVNVCLCSILPTQPIPTNTRIVVLHHPHEQRHKLATVPVLSKCLESIEVKVGRKLRYGDSKVLDCLYDRAVVNPDLPLRAIYLFPGTDSQPSTEINQWKSSVSYGGLEDIVLIAFDGTWKHAKEMVQASSSFLSKFATQVYLTYNVDVDGGTIFDSALILRKEPFSGCMSTMEAVARCLSVLEPQGTDVELRLIEVLRTMVQFQACFLKPMKPRPKVLKKGKEDEKKSKTETLPKSF